MVGFVCEWLENIMRLSREYDEHNTPLKERVFPENPKECKTVGCKGCPFAKQTMKNK